MATNLIGQCITAQNQPLKKETSSEKENIPNLQDLDSVRSKEHDFQNSQRGENNSSFNIKPQIIENKTDVQKNENNNNNNNDNNINIEDQNNPSFVKKENQENKENKEKQMEQQQQQISHSQPNNSDQKNLNQNNIYSSQVKNKNDTKLISPEKKPPRPVPSNSQLKKEIYLNQPQNNSKLQNSQLSQKSALNQSENSKNQENIKNQSNQEYEIKVQTASQQEKNLEKSQINDQKTFKSQQIDEPSKQKQEESKEKNESHGQKLELKDFEESLSNFTVEEQLQLQTSAKNQLKQNQLQQKQLKKEIDLITQQSQLQSERDKYAQDNDLREKQEILERKMKMQEEKQVQLERFLLKLQSQQDKQVKTLEQEKLSAQKELAKFKREQKKKQIQEEKEKLKQEIEEQEKQIQEIKMKQSKQSQLAPLNQSHQTNSIQFKKMTSMVGDEEQQQREKRLFSQMTLKEINSMASSRKNSVSPEKRMNPNHIQPSPLEKQKISLKRGYSQQPNTNSFSVLGGDKDSISRTSSRGKMYPMGAEHRSPQQNLDLLSQKSYNSRPKQVIFSKLEDSQLETESNLDPEMSRLYSEISVRKLQDKKLNEVEQRLDEELDPIKYWRRGERSLSVEEQTKIKKRNLRVQRLLHKIFLSKKLGYNKKDYPELFMSPTKRKRIKQQTEINNIISEKEEIKYEQDLKKRQLEAQKRKPRPRDYFNINELKTFQTPLINKPKKNNNEYNSNTKPRNRPVRSKTNFTENKANRKPSNKPYNEFQTEMSKNPAFFSSQKQKQNNQNCQAGIDHCECQNCLNQLKYLGYISRDPKTIGNTLSKQNQRSNQIYKQNLILRTIDLQNNYNDISHQTNGQLLNEILNDDLSSSFNNNYNKTQSKPSNNLIMLKPYGQNTYSVSQNNVEQPENLQQYANTARIQTLPVYQYTISPTNNSKKKRNILTTLYNIEQLQTERKPYTENSPYAQSQYKQNKIKQNRILRSHSSAGQNQRMNNTGQNKMHQQHYQLNQAPDHNHYYPKHYQQQQQNDYNNKGQYLVNGKNQKRFDQIQEILNNHNNLEPPSQNQYYGNSTPGRLSHSKNPQNNYNNNNYNNNNQNNIYPEKNPNVSDFNCANNINYSNILNNSRNHTNNNNNNNNQYNNNNSYNNNEHLSQQKNNSSSKNVMQKVSTSKTSLKNQKEVLLEEKCREIDLSDLNQSKNQEVDEKGEKLGVRAQYFLLDRKKNQK
ncbi:hypothetical protein PPERSA_10938 [Pseudocohnilembus persalinus]|uniref:Uncharacterized protein n=1 Tax=Pseudocohnilembus persalinus TaxID=266149 RepID=A0A0V0QCH7_PSEPJ|nr:hypothetical protein PPERSA_10938 [Pseudocohnilembus persalinus]|eukprot:KRW99819.1 hypothetical protein PPERSA_10938 [Pseudocohnilembus persalinus]